MNFFDKLRVSDSNGKKSWTNTLSVWGFVIGALYVITCTVAGLLMAVPEWMTGAYTEVILVLVGAVSVNMAVRNVAVHWGSKDKEKAAALLESTITKEEKEDAKET